MTAAPAPSIRRRVAIGASLMVLLRLSFRGIGLVSTLILVRLLLPADFGLVGLATVAYTAFNILGQLSFDLALVRMTSPQRIHYDTAWTMSVIRGAVIAALVVATSPLLAEFINEPRVIKLSYVLAGLGFLGGFENIALVDFQRNLQYDRLFWYQISGKVAGVLFTIPAAFLLRNYWALICGLVATRLTTLLLSYALKPYRPHFELAGWHDLFNFSKWLMITNVLSVIDNYCMTLTVGRISGTAAIGVYQVAYEIGSLPASEIAAPIRDPIFSGYSRIADNLDLLRKHFLSNLSLLILVITPMSLGICMMADPIIALFFGHKWMAAAPLIRLTALYALFEAIGHSATAIYMALHRQRVFVEIYAFIVTIRVPAIVIGAYLDGIFGATVALALTGVLNMTLWNGFAPLEPRLKVQDLWTASWRTIVASILMVLGVELLLEFWSEPRDLLFGLIRFTTICLAGAVIQAVTQYSAWILTGSPATAEAEVLQFARALLQRVAVMLRRETAQLL